MSKLKLYATSYKLNKGSTVRCDDTLFLAVMAEALKNSHETYADYVRSVLAAVCLDRTYGDISQQGKLIEGNAYYTESDIRVYESQIETLKNQLVDCAEELKSRDISYQKLREQDQSEMARLKAQNQNQSWEEFIDSAKSQPPQTQPPTQFIAGINQNQAATNPFQAGLDLSERGTNQPVAEIVPIDMVELINENFLEVIGNQLVVEYFNQQNKLNQSFGISGFSGTFKVVEEIPNSLLEHYPLVVYWKKQVGQFENAVVNATEALFEKDNVVQQVTRNEQLALVTLTKREQMLWWLITHFG